jgi:hypothetical protein
MEWQTIRAHLFSRIKLTKSLSAARNSASRMHCQIHPLSQVEMNLPMRGKPAADIRQTFRGKSAIVVTLKFAITLGCFWYVTRNIDFQEIGPLIRKLDFVWAGCALLALTLQIPLVALRWGGVVDALGDRGQVTPRLAMTAVTAIGTFFGQILPNPGGDAVRTWMLVRLGHRWTRAVNSILIDRAIGLLVLLVIVFVTLMFQPDFESIFGNRLLLMAIIAIVLAVGLVSISIVPDIAPTFEQWRLTKPVAYVARGAYKVFRRSDAILPILGAATAIHFMTILAIMVLAGAQGHVLSFGDASVLFAMIVLLSFLPISISGWGVREVAVTAFLQSYGMSQAQGLFFSVCFGIFLIAASLPGAIVYAAYSPRPVIPRASLAKHSGDHSLES